MATQIEEQQTKDFLKRAEIRTMKKDLQSLRESDALKERDKIVKIKTFEEQQKEQEKKLEQIREQQGLEEKEKREEILEWTASQERVAEKDLKNYATEEERQDIFLLESQRLSFGKQEDENNAKKEPDLKLKKNEILVEQKDFKEKLDKILEDEKKLENEQKLILEKHDTTTVPSEKKSLEQRRGDLEKDIQDVEKKRWEVEKQIQDSDDKIKGIDQALEQIVNENNELRNKILGIDKSLREIYSSVIARVEEKRRGEAVEQKSRREELSKVRTEEKEKVQREQWRGGPKKENFLDKIDIPVPARKKLAETAGIEEEQRKKFISDVEDWAKTGEKPQENSLPPIPKK